jgi:hypothetical protein
MRRHFPLLPWSLSDHYFQLHQCCLWVLIHHSRLSHRLRLSVRWFQ